MKEYENHTADHVWKLREGGSEVDIFACGSGSFCNGPRCVNCGYGFCHHCRRLPATPCPVALKAEEMQAEEEYLI